MLYVLGILITAYTIKYLKNRPVPIDTREMEAYQKLKKALEKRGIDEN